jgi:putative sigma-54 modulation protein
MKVNLKGKNVQITDGIREYAEKRFQRLDKYFDKDFEVNATLSVEKDLHKIDVVLPLSGFVIKGEDKTRDMYNTIDNVIDKIERQIRKYKTRITVRASRLTLRMSLFRFLKLKNWRWRFLKLLKPKDLQLAHEQGRGCFTNGAS